MDPIAWAGVGVAAFTAITSYILARRGARDRSSQQQVADKIATDKARLDETQQALDAYERLIDVHQKEIQRLHSDASEALKRLTVEREHSLRERERHADLSDRYRRTLMELLQALMTLKNLVDPADTAAIEKVMIDAAETMKAPPPDPETA